MKKILILTILHLLCVSGYSKTKKNVYAVFDKIAEKQISHNLRNISLYEKKPDKYYMHFSELKMNKILLKRKKILVRYLIKNRINVFSDFYIVEGVKGDKIIGRIWNKSYDISYMYSINDNKIIDYVDNKKYKYLIRDNTKEESLLFDCDNIFYSVEQWQGKIFNETFSDIEVLGGLTFIASKVNIVNNKDIKVYTTIFYEFRELF
ncbi:MAG: hypothetical protein N4A72_22990 [Bacteroidales bacterium]|jgi:hypothetical protein|nr:hypothetical protein [Bacteroidales bacterium]